MAQMSEREKKQAALLKEKEKEKEKEKIHASDTASIRKSGTNKSKHKKRRPSNKKDLRSESKEEESTTLASTITSVLKEAKSPSPAFKTIITSEKQKENMMIRSPSNTSQDHEAMICQN